MPQNQTCCDLIIIGAGTAGLSAAIYAQRAGKQAIVFERGMFGGQIVNTPDIENYPGIAHISGFDFAMDLYKQASDLGADIVSEEITALRTAKDAKIIQTSAGEYCARALILALGARNRPLGLAGEEELVGKGITYCATCDGMFFKGKDVAVNGGGNTAVEDALFLSNSSSHVYLIYRGAQLKADAMDVEKLKKCENVTFLFNTEVTALKQENGVLSSISLHSAADGSDTELPVSALFIAIGQIPNTEICKGIVALDGHGYVITDEDLATSVPGIYAAGDCRSKKIRQLTTAASDGAQAALEACRHL